MHDLAKREQVMDLVQTLPDEQIHYVLNVIQSLPQCWRIDSVYYQFHQQNEARCKADEKAWKGHRKTCWLLLYRIVESKLILSATATDSHADIFGM